VTASIASGNLVSLTNDFATSLGNATITETVTDAGFIVFGMAGGVAGDCAVGVGCTSNDDCATGACDIGNTDKCI